MRKQHQSLLLLGFILFTTSVFAQIPASRSTKVTPASIETSASIMDRQSRIPDGKRPEMEEREGPNRKRLPQNPLAKPNSQFPALDANITGATSLNAPQTISTSFNGVTGPTETGAFPPDNMGTVGPTQYVVFVNGRLRSFNKTTGVADGVLNVNPDVFFASVITPAGANEVSFTSDPRIRYDRLSGKWILIIIDVTLNTVTNNTLANRVLIAYSNSSTLTAGTVWTFSQFTGQAGVFMDYPTLGVDINALYIGGNMFNLAGTTFIGTNGYVINRTNLLSGGPYTVYTFANLATGAGAGPYTPQGVDNFNTAATEGYFIGVDNATFGTLMMRRVSTPAGVPTISANISITVSTTAYPRTVPHLGNTGGANGNLDALDDRLFAAMARGGHIWTAHNIGVNTLGVATSTTSVRRNGVRWYDLTNITGVPSINQSGTIFDNNATLASARDYFIPSIMVSGQNHAAFSLSTAGTPNRSDAATAGRLSGDLAGTMQAPALTTASSTAYNPASDPGGASGRRWGDYSYVSLDPLDDMTMWMINQYCNGTNTYGCNVTKLMAPPPATPASCSPSSIAAGQVSVNVTLTGTVVSGSGFYDPGTDLPAPALAFNHIAGAVSGVTVNSVTYTNPTTVVLNLNTTGATAGTKNVTITNPDGQSLTGNNILTITAASLSADLSISKTDGTTTYTPGGSTTYTIVASNAGPDPVTGATVADVFPAAISSVNWTAVYAGGASGPAAGSGNINATVNIPSGGSATFTASCTISSGASGNLVNTATVTAPGGVTDPTPGNNSATDTDTPTPSADLTITKTDGVTTYTPGGSLTYTIVAANSGPSNVTGATVTDVFPAAITAANWTAVYAGGASGPAAGSGNINATVNIPAGGSAAFTASCTISAGASGSLSNTATVSPPGGVTDPTPGNNSATDTDSGTPSADLTITKTDGATTYTPGGSLTYTIVAANSGPSNVTGATVADVFPAAITSVSWTAVYAGGASGPAAGSGNINATVNIPAGGSATFTANCTVSAAATGSLSNTATVSPPGGVTDPTPGNNSATDTDTGTPSADLTISKTDGTTTYIPGGSLTYTIVATNNGPSNVTSATITDVFPAAITSVNWTAVYAGGASGPAAGSGNINATVNIPPGGSATFTASCTVSAGASGNLVNTATVTTPGGVTDPTPGNNAATDTDTQSATPCILTCPANITQANDLNQCGAVVTFPAPTISGSCGTVTASPASGSFFPVGTTTVNVTSTAGPSCSFTVTVNDTQSPVLTCPGPVTVSCATAVPAANIAAVTGVSDNCSGAVTVTHQGDVISNQTCANKYTITRTYRATDASNNFAECTQIITVNDVTAPVLTCPAPVTVSCAAAVPAANIAAVTGVSDNCSGAVTVTHQGDVISNLTCANRYSITRTYRATDACGNFAECTQIITVNDVTAPTLTCPAPVTVSCAAAVPAANIAAVTGVSDNCSGAVTVTFVSDVISNQTCANRYTITRTYRATDVCGNFANCTQIITVNDVTAPVLTCPAPVTVSCAAAVPAANIATVTGVSDNCSGAVTVTHQGDVISNQTCANRYTITRTYRATDACGNFANCTQIITVNDQTAPVITCPANITATTPIGSCTVVVNFTVTATDNCTGAVTIVSSPASGSAFPIGTTTVTSTATDACGNSSNCTFTVTVIDGQLPVITSQPANRTVCTGTNATFNVVSTNAVSYQWQTWNGSAWVNVPSSNAASLTLNAVTVTQNTNTYRVIVNGLCTSVTSNAATLFVNALPLVNLTTSRIPILLPTESVTITANTIPSGGSYVWFKNGVVMPGVTGAVLANLTVDNIGVYKVVYTDPNGCISTSGDITVSGAFSTNLFVYPNPNLGQFQVRFYNQPNESVTLAVFDAKGDLVYKKKAVTTTAYTVIDVDLGGAPAGSYLVKLLNSSNKVVGAKWIVLYH